MVGYLDLHRVVGDDPVAPLDELNGHLALAHAGLPLDEHSFAVDLHEHAGAGDLGGQVVEQAADEAAHKGGGVLRRAQHCAVVLDGHFHALGVGFQSPGEDQGRHRIGQQLVKAGPPLLRGHLVQEGVLSQADDQQPPGVKVLKKTAQGQAGPVYIQGGQGGVLIVGPLVEDLQIKFPDDLPQLHAFRMFCHWIVLLRFVTWRFCLVYPISFHFARAPGVFCRFFLPGCSKKISAPLKKILAFP